MNDYDGNPTQLDGVEANANLLEVLVDRLGRSSHCATNDAYDAELFLMRATIHRRAGAFRFHRDDVRGDAVHVLLRGVLSAAEELE